MSAHRKKGKGDEVVEIGNDLSIIEKIVRAKKAGRTLLRKSAQDRRDVLMAIADKIFGSMDSILQANARDIENFAHSSKGMNNEDVLKKRLVLSKSKVNDIVSGIKAVAQMRDPVGEVLLARDLDSDLRLEKISCPIGLIGIIFESRPDALPQILSLCLKTANAAVLKGGREAEQTNKCIFACVQESLSECGFDPDIFVLTHKREDVEDMLAASGVVDLIVPRGSNELVQHIMDNTQIPVLGHAAGVCHIFVDSGADLEMALKICLEAKTSYPAACNAVEAILVHEDIAGRFLPRLLEAMADSGVESRCDTRALELTETSKATGDGAKNNAAHLNVALASDEDFGREFSNLTVALKVVDSIDQAIDHINKFGSRHTDAIISESSSNAERFFNEVDSAGVYHNASTRFADGFRYGFGAEVGIATGKLHPRGPVGIDGLMTYKYKLRGRGHIASDYTGEGARKFTHIDIDKSK